MWLLPSCWRKCFGFVFDYTVFNFLSSLVTRLERFGVASSFVLERMFLVYFSVIQSLIYFLGFSPP